MTAREMIFLKSENQHQDIVQHINRTTHAETLFDLVGVTMAAFEEQCYRNRSSTRSRYFKNFGAFNEVYFFCAYKNK